MSEERQKTERDGKQEGVAETEQSSNFRYKQGFVWGLILLVIIVLTGLGFIYAEFAHYQNKIDGQMVKLQAQLNVGEIAVPQQNKISKANQVAIANLTQRLGGDQSVWMLAEAEYLIRLANLNLHFQHNVTVAIELLKTVDSHLQKFNDHKFLDLRKALAKDIVKLQAVPKVDVPGIYLQLQALSEQVDKLPLIIENQGKTVQVAPPEEQTTKRSGWKKTLQSGWQTIGKVLIIRHRDQPIKPLLTFKQHEFLNLNLHVLFAQAQWAVLQHQAEIYHSCLQQIQALIKDNFIQTNAATKNLMITLKQLQKIDINPKLPDIGDLLEVMQQINNTQAKQIVSKKVVIAKQPKPLRQAKNGINDDNADEEMQ
jgi:uroporphyrin-III C-methyltransferase